MHLGDAQVLGDLQLGHVAVEAHRDDPPLPRRQLLEQRSQGFPILHRLHVLIRFGQNVSQRVVAVLVAVLSTVVVGVEVMHVGTEVVLVLVADVVVVGIVVGDAVLVGSVDRGLA